MPVVLSGKRLTACGLWMGVASVGAVAFRFQPHSIGGLPRRASHHERPDALAFGRPERYRPGDSTNQPDRSGHANG
jgi:hypothetical protein